jgi:hypothetical protein
MNSAEDWKTAPRRGMSSIVCNPRQGYRAMSDSSFQHIEFCGVAASGKSTAAFALRDMLREQGRTVITASDLPRLAAARRRGWLAGAILPTSLLRWMTPDMGVPALGRFVAARPAILDVLANALSSPYMDNDDRLPAATSLLHTATCYQMASECLRNDETLVLDEGFAHRGLTTFGYRTAGVPPGKVERYAEVIPCPAWLVFMDTPARICLARIRTRPSPPRPCMTVLPDPDLERCLADAAARLDVVAQVLARRGARVLRLSGEGHLDGLRAIVAAAASPGAKR